MIIHRLLDFLFPVRKSELLVRLLTTDAAKNLYTPDTIHDTFYLLHYENPDVQALIAENKFYQNENAQKILAAIVELWIETQTEPIRFVPIPLGKDRKKERGYNQVTEVLKKLHCNTNVVVDEKLLQRKRETVPQTSLARTARLRNVVDAFTCQNANSIAGTSETIVLVDDVITTGSTLAVARATLAPHLPPNTKLICLAFAH